ncbi:MAG: MATE family efflux transporter [Oscillospiraceae bacterium]|nr:MATE family efflux transporter [Oscillospiraceae bacterium]
MNDRQKITLNISANLLSLAITILISMFITPWIVNTLGGEAYGFVGLAQNFVNYASLVTVALNSMSSRFISIEIYKKDYDAANRFFTSTFLSNLLIAVAMTPVFAVIVLHLEHLVNVPAELLVDVKIAFAITFLQFLLNVLLSRYEIATFVTNRLYLNQKNNLISSGLRLLLILLFFTFLSVRISYLVLATFIGVVFTYVMNVIYTKRYLPQMKIRRKDFDFGCIKQLLSSGIWSLVNKLSSLLMDGLDLLLSNLFIGPVQMGALSLSKTIPTMFYSLRGSLDYPFAPPMTQCYANGDIKGVVRNARTANKVLGVIMIAPIAAFIVYGFSFFRLWVPGEDSLLIQTLAILSLVNLLASACINSVFTVFSITNHVKIPAFMTLLNGLLTVVINFLLLNFTDLGIYAIAGTASILGMIRNYIFTPLYGAHCLKVKKSTFYHEILTGNVCLVLNVLVGLAFHFCISTGSTWVSLILSAGSMTVLCIVINAFIVLDRSERNAVIGAVRNKLKRSKTS